MVGASCLDVGATLLALFSRLFLWIRASSVKLSEIRSCDHMQLVVAANLICLFFYFLFSYLRKKY